MATLLVIAGLDPTGGAGLLADARVAADHGVRAVGVCTALTVQDTHGMHESSVVPPAVVEAQLDKLLNDAPVDAVKIGMLGDERLAQIIVKKLAPLTAPIVWDPVMRPSRGKSLLLSGDLASAAAELLLRVRVVTPNLAEAEAMTGIHVQDLESMRQAAAALIDAGTAAVLVKGGHLTGGRSIDLLMEGQNEVLLDAEHFETGPLHGTGCVLSSAIACGLATGATLPVSAGLAKKYLTFKLRSPIAVGGGAKTLV